jgi:hypothetical protein
MSSKSMSWCAVIIGRRRRSTVCNGGIEHGVSPMIVVTSQVPSMKPFFIFFAGRRIGRVFEVPGNDHASWVTLQTPHPHHRSRRLCGANADLNRTCRRTQKLRALKILCATGNDNGLVFLANTVKQGWPSQLCSENILFWTHRPRVCSATQNTANMLHRNIENYPRDEFSRNGRRRGVGLV